MKTKLYPSNAFMPHFNLPFQGKPEKTGRPYGMSWKHDLIFMYHKKDIVKKMETVQMP